MQLKQDIRNRDIKNLYLFHGPEEYLIEKYLRQIKEIVPHGEFNYYQFDDLVDLSEIADIVEQYPQMSERTMLVLKDSGILKTNTKEKKQFIENIPCYIVVVFIEKDAAKLSKALVGLIDNVVKFDVQKSSDLRAWTLRQFADRGKTINLSDAEYLIQICEMSLGKIEIEVEKLCSASGGSKEVTRQLVERLVPVPLDYKVFDFVNLLLNKEEEKAYTMMHEFKCGREEPIVLLSIVFSQINSIVMVKNLRDSYVNNIEEYFASNKRFLVPRILRELGRYDFQNLRSAMQDCSEFDFAIKTGKIDSWVAIELLVVKLLKQI